MQESEKKFLKIYSGYRHAIYRICYGYVYDKELVEDLFQEIMLNIWNSIEKFRGDSSAETWAYRVAVNTALLFNKKIKKERIVKSVKEPSLSYPDTSDMEAIKEKELKLDKLASSISVLEKEERIIITLILEGLTYDQVSEIVGITPNYVGVKVNRIKKQLYKDLINK
ncbi:RNA polymerase sigma factor [Bacteroidota bacterium]